METRRAPHLRSRDRADELTGLQNRDAGLNSLTGLQFMNNRILVVLPTRGRPWAAMEATASIMKHSTGLADLAICCDQTDPKPFFIEAPRVRCFYAHHLTFGQWVNSTVMRHINDYDWFTWAADDLRYLTPAWDVRVVAHSELVVYGPDNIQNHRMATHPFFQARLPKQLGFVAPPVLKHGCLDVFVEGVARELGSVAYDPELQMDHLHHSVGRSSFDTTYREVDWPSDMAAWEQSIKPKLGHFAAKLRGI